MPGALGAVAFIHLAVLGEDPEPVQTAVRELGADRVILVGSEDEAAAADELVQTLGPMGIDTETRSIDAQPLLGFIRAFQEIASEHADRREDLIVNLAAADKQTACEALSGAFVAGLKAIDRPGEEFVFLPILQFSYDEVVTDAKLEILEALQQMGGEVSKLSALADEVGIQDSLASYHVRGGEDGKGLVELGLVDVERGHRGALTIRLTSMGELMAQGLGSPLESATR